MPHPTVVSQQLSAVFKGIFACLQVQVFIAEFFMVQGVPTGLGHEKCNVLKLKKVCERSELRLQKDPIKRGKLVILMM